MPSQCLSSASSAPLTTLSLRRIPTSSTPTNVALVRHSLVLDAFIYTHAPVSGNDKRIYNPGDLYDKEDIIRGQGQRNEHSGEGEFRFAGAVDSQTSNALLPTNEQLSENLGATSDPQGGEDKMDIE